MHTPTRRFVAMTAIALFAQLAFAHHNQANTYKEGRPVSWEGTVTFVSWDGAHVMYQIDVKNAAGVVESWQVLGGSPQRLAKRGIRKGTVRAGEPVTVAGYLSLGSRIVTPVYLQPSDGRKLFVGYTADDTTFKAPPLN